MGAAQVHMLLLLLLTAHLQALSVDSVASIFSMGGYWPYSST